MALMLGALREALVAAGAPEDKADKAAEEVAGYDKDLASVKADLLLLKWMVGVNTALVLIVMGKLFI